MNKILEAITTFFVDMLKGAISTIFEFIGAILMGALDIEGGELSPGGMIGAHPATWNGGGVWTTVQTISDHAIVPIALLVLMIVLVNELIQILTSGNQFESAGIAPMIKWSLKTFVGIALVANIFNIASGVFTLGVYAGTAGMEQVAPVMNFSVSFEEVDLSIPILSLLLIIALLTLLLVCSLLISILVVLAGRMIEVFMYLSIAPLTTATFMNSEWRSVGSNWFKGLAALAFQGLFIVIAIAIFTRIFTNIVGIVNGAGEEVSGIDLIFRMLMLAAYTLALTMTVFRSGSISKSMLGAH